MSEEILKALIQLFAIIAKQEGSNIERDLDFVRLFLTKQVQSHRVDAYLNLFDEKINEGVKKENRNSRLTSVKDSVRILKICKKINKTLDHNQKVISLLRLLEMIHNSRQENKQQNAIAETVADVFNINREEYSNLQKLVFETEIENFESEEFLIVSADDTTKPFTGQMSIDTFENNILFLKVRSANLFLFKHCCISEMYMNGLPIEPQAVQVFSIGSSLRLQSGRPIYYSDINDRYLKVGNSDKILYQAKDLNYTFENGNLGIQEFNLTATENSLIGIMGASGSGKSTLLNLMAGMNKPTSGEIFINGLNLNSQTEELQGVIGFIPQDDLLFETLSVYENLYYNAEFCFKSKTKIEIELIVNSLLEQLSLLEIKDLKVGSPLNKLISGGQRKRLNIALELMREPSILFVDEPTSGLSSKDSENVMTLLRELSLKGKIIFIVIHQPSSDVYKVFDQILMLDEGGLTISYGNPVDSIRYFRKIDGMAAFENVECSSCGNVNPEQLFNIVQAKEINEFGKYTKERKRNPKDWHKLYKKAEQQKEVPHDLNKPPKSLEIPKKTKQWWIYFKRDLKSKTRNKQYMLIAMLEAPFLAVILAYLIRYIPEGDNYLFRFNENIPQYIFMLVIVALFIGMTISAEEIFKDRKIVKRERFLNLSKSSYLLAKLAVLVIISAIQSFLFIAIGNWISMIEGMFLSYWLAFFSVAVFSNLLGLIISSSFDDVVTIYIIIPMMLIPQMILGGAMFSFDKLNKSIVRIDKVPVVAEFMVSKWAYEGLIVDQFKNNRFEVNFFESERKESVADYYQVFYIPELMDILDQIKTKFNSGEEIVLKDKCLLLANEGKKQNKILKDSLFTNLDLWAQGNILDKNISNYKKSIKKLESHYTRQFLIANNEREAFLSSILDDESKRERYLYLRDHYHNESLEDLVRKKFEKNKVVQFDNQLVQNIEPIYQMPVVHGNFDFRSHLFAPKKHIFGHYFETLWFNLSMIWIMSILLFIALRLDIFRKLVLRIQHFSWKPSPSKKQ